MSATDDRALAPRPHGVHPARTWLTAALAAGAAATLMDAALLQQRRSFFTGGFLASTHTTSWSEATGFLALSFLVDASLAALLVVLLIWVTAHIRLTRCARLFCLVGGALLPLLVWNFVAYRLLTFLGDAFDLGLMYDLAGRRPSEVFAVASAHIATPTALAASGLLLLAVATWAVNRYGPGRAERATARSRALKPAVLLFVAGFVGAGIAAAGNDTFEDGLRRKPSGALYGRVRAAITDFDGDGYGIGGRLSDPAPFDAAIYPYALDIPGNGIDENGVGGDLPAGVPAYEEAPATTGPWRHRPDVVLIVLESFRADALHRDVNGRAVTPVLDALAREGISSSRAYSHNGYTVQSRQHLFTGSLAGIRAGTLIDDFNANGYETAYFSAQDESFGGPAAGVGFDRADVAYDARQDRDRRYSTFTTAGSLAVSHRTLQERLDAYLASRDRSRPLFLYLNFHDTHFPYHHREIETLVSHAVVPQRQIAPSRMEDLQAMYWNTAANVDRAVGRALDAITRTQGGAPAVIVTADHGESLFDEGFLGHGYALNDVQTRIPLIIRGIAAEVHEPFGQVDLRDILALALTADDPAAPPRLVTSPRKAVFQYLGTIRRPRQIALADGTSRTTYDFRDDLVVLADARPVRAAGLDSSARVAFLGLIHFWERMMLARDAAGAETVVE